MDGSYLKSLREQAQEGDVPVYNALTARFQLGSGNASTRSDIDLYIDPVAGDDTNPGTAALPIRSFERADQLTALVIDHVVQWHLKAATYTLPARGWWISSRIIRGGRFRIFADEAWDPAVYTQAMTGTCDVGTSRVQVVVAGGGLAVNALQNKTIEITSGPAAGWRMDIVSNTATTIRGSAGWDMAAGVAVPGVGDTFRVFDADGTTLLLPGNAEASASGYQLVQRTVGGSPASLQVYNNVPGAILWQGFRLGATNSAQVAVGSVDADLICIHGVTLLSTMQNGWFLFYGRQMYLGTSDYFGIANKGLYREWHGWGLRCTTRAPLISQGGVAEGFLNMVDSSQPEISVDFPFGGTWNIYGGRIGRVFSGSKRANYQFVKEYFSDTVQPKMPTASPSASEFFNLETFAQNSLAELRGVEVAEMGAPISIRGPGATAILHGQDRNAILRNPVPGSTVFEFDNGVCVRIVGIPTGLTQSTGGTPQTDWTIDGVAVDPLIAFANNGDFILGARGTLVRRID